MSSVSFVSVLLLCFLTLGFCIAFGCGVWQCIALLCITVCVVVLELPFDEVVDEVFHLLVHLGFLQGDGVTLIGDLHYQLLQFVQLPLDLEQTLGGQSKPAQEVG